MCKYYLNIGRFWICLDCKIAGVEINNRQFEVQFPYLDLKEGKIFTIKEFPKWIPERFNNERET